MSPGRTKHVCILRWTSILSKLEKSIKKTFRHSSRRLCWCEITRLFSAGPLNHYVEGTVNRFLWVIGYVIDFLLRYWLRNWFSFAWLVTWLIFLCGIGYACADDDWGPMIIKDYFSSIIKISFLSIKCRYFLHSLFL